jgi:hypothetical protein
LNTAIRLSLVVTALSLGGLGGCGPTSSDRCDGVSCPTGQSCDPADGQCKAGGTRCNPACSGTTPVCDEATFACKTCTATQGCSGATPFCDTAANAGAGRCVGCRESADCSGATPICDTGTRTCVTCTSTSGCSTSTFCDTQAASGKGACVSCLSNSHCGGATPYCSTGTGTCVACATDAHCSGGTPKCSPTSQSCVQCVSQGDCGSAESCESGLCILPDSCSTPGSLVLPSSEELTFQVDTTGATDAEQGSCNASSDSRELVYRLTLTATRNLTLTATAPTGASSDPVLYVRQGTCGNTGGQLGCVDEISSSDTLELKNLAPGDYFLFIETYGTYHGPLEVTVKLAAPPANETCASPALVSFTGNTATFLADTSTAADDHLGSCSDSTATSRELVYQFSLTQTQDVTVVATPTTGSGADAVLYLKKDACESGVEISCADYEWNTSSQSSSGETLRAYRLPAGTYFLFVETWSVDTGPLDVTISLSGPSTAPSNDTCGSAEALVFSGTSATTSGDLALASSAEIGSCAPWSGHPDLFYSFTLPAPAATLEIAVSPAAGSSLDAVVYLRGTPCTDASTANELACRDASFTAGTGETAYLTNIPAGTYYVVVEGWGNSIGAFELSVTYTP